jgi:hypothetical protein
MVEERHSFRVQMEEVRSEFRIRLDQQSIEMERTFMERMTAEGARW